MPRIKAFVLLLSMFGLISAFVFPYFSENNSAQKHPHLNKNSLSTNALTLNQLAINALSTHEIEKGELKLNPEATSGIEETDEGRELLKYIASCALPLGKEISTTVSGVTYTFKGNLGLAPEWLNAPLSEIGQRWVSACLLAHVNAFGVKVPISVRGPHPAINEISKEEQEEFPVEEAAFYGNLFQNMNDKYVCAGSHEKTSSEYLQLRVCSEVPGPNNLTKCEFFSMGSCGPADKKTSNQTSIACNGKDNTNGFFTSCHAGDKTYEEVITIYLKKEKEEKPN